MIESCLIKSEIFVSLDRDECSSNPCKNSGTCVEKVADYQCTCLIGFTGKNCESGEWYSELKIDHICIHLFRCF